LFRHAEIPTHQSREARSGTPSGRDCILRRGAPDGRGSWRAAESKIVG
jgi:hypothetical protein